MILKKQELKEIVKYSSNIKLYFLNTKDDLPENVTLIIDELNSMKSELSYETDLKDDYGYVEELSSAIEGLGELYFEYEWDNSTITVIFDEGFAVEFSQWDEHELYDYEKIKMSMDRIALKDGKTISDVKQHLDVLRKLFNL
ncbi:hypothetical protein D3C81_654480 [compost metagenome]